MQDFADALQATIDVLDTPLTIWGFEFSFWQIFLWTGFASIVAWIIGKVISGD